jgi:hypothetical protein
MVSFLSNNAIEMVCSIIAVIAPRIIACSFAMHHGPQLIAFEHLHKSKGLRVRFAFPSWFPYPRDKATVGSIP